MFLFSLIRNTTLYTRDYYMLHLLTKQYKLTVFVIITLLMILPLQIFAGLHPSYSEQAVADTVPYFDTDGYDLTVPNPNEYFSAPVGKWPARYSEIVRYIQVLADRSDRVLLKQHGETHEGRPLYNVFVSTPENLHMLETHRSTMADIADPTVKIEEAKLTELIKNQPAFAWLGYSIHGDEISGSDASVRLLWHLAAAQDSVTKHILNNLILIIDPSENPDGRERYLSMLETYRSHVPNWDSRAMQHRGVWPWGRSNHYLFDLNRDWILVNQPETKGRLKTLVAYHPILAVDAHEMGSNATYLFSPPRQPINYNTPSNVTKWYEKFAQDQAEAFDQRGWPYYTGEWNEQWYIGYGSAWPTMTGTIGILYEQAGVDGEFVKQRDDYLLTYHESVNHQFTSSLANIQTTANNRVEMLKDYRNARSSIVKKGHNEGRKYLIVPDGDKLKLNRFVQSLLDQGIEIKRATASFTVSDVTSTFGNEIKSKDFPTGTYIVNTAQASGALAKAILEFDERLNLKFLKEERRELEKHNDTRMYEISSWSIPLAYDLDAYQTNSRFTVSTETVSSVVPPKGTLIHPKARYGYLIDMEGELTWRVLTQLYDAGVTVYASEKKLTIEGRAYQRGAILIRKRGNAENIATILATIAEDIGVNIYGVNSGYSSAGSKLGAPTFRLLRQPRIALVTGNPVNYTSIGSLWFTIDKQLEIPHSLLELNDVLFSDISKYNVLVLPDVWGGQLGARLGQQGKQKLTNWMRDGGTLVLMGSSAVWAADSTTGLSQVRLKRQMLDKLAKYDRAVSRELAAEAPDIDTIALWHPELVKEKINKNDDSPKAKGKTGKEAEEYDQWSRRFYPRGVIMRAEIEQEDWLSFGMNEQVPVMVYTSYAFLSSAPVKTTARFAEKNKIRLSGLLWPEAQQRWGTTAYATHERIGKGQLILFASNPNFRAYWYGTRRMFANAILYGPGFTSGFEPYQQ